MTLPKFYTSDIEHFASHLGFEGIDTDLFYEAYYSMTDEYDDYESQWETNTESIESY